MEEDITNAFLLDEDILHNYQLGFRGNDSTNLCLSFLTDKVLKRSYHRGSILKRFDEGLLTGMILIDLQKAFDAIDFVTKAIKFSGSTMKWFKSYLFERIFLLNIENKRSEFGKISCGVSQGVHF